MIEQALLVHYPSGGFGHYINAVLSLCAKEFYVQEKNLNFSTSGDSHAFALSAKKWQQLDPAYTFAPAPWARGQDRRHIVLVDSGIVNDRMELIRERFPHNQIIRMCIDPDARSIVNQTRLFKAQRQKAFDFVSKTDWEQREEISKQYHYADREPTYFLNNFQPCAEANIINVPISWLFTNMPAVVDLLEQGLDISIDRNLLTTIHQEFLQTNQQYSAALFWSQQILQSLLDQTNLDISACSTIHDQGYVNYVLERHYGLPEIPPFDYQNWFLTTQDLAQAIQKLVNEKENTSNQ